jgi:hypothetical protein
VSLTDLVEYIYRRTIKLTALVITDKLTCGLPIPVPAVIGYLIDSERC